MHSYTVQFTFPTQTIRPSNPSRYLPPRFSFMQSDSMNQPLNQVKYSPEEFQKLIDTTCEILDCKQDLLKGEISTRTRGSIQTTLGYLYSTPVNIIKSIVFSSGAYKCDGSQAEYIKTLLDTHDVRNNVYEGGFKVWEGAKDLINYLDSSQIVSSQLETKEELNILEVGSGAALPAIHCLKKLLKDYREGQIFRIDVQDFNKEVLNYLVPLNLIINLEFQTISELLKLNRINAFYGPWCEFSSDIEYDMIVMSETIYNIDSYDSLHNLLVKNLKKDGVAVLATKDTYFGCTGSLFDWEDFIKDKKSLSISSVSKLNSIGIPRSVVIMKRLI